jgi:hypothetical protein
MIILELENYGVNSNNYLPNCQAFCLNRGISVAYTAMKPILKGSANYVTLDRKNYFDYSFFSNNKNGKKMLEEFLTKIMLEKSREQFKKGNI